MTTHTRLPRSTPEAQGIPSAAISVFIEEAEKSELELHSFMLVRNGHVVAEGWWKPYAPERPHMLFSLTKSFTSTAVGLAVAEGRLSVDDPVLSFFPEEKPEQVGPHLAAMRVRHLLSMSTGHAKDTTGYMHRRRDGNWVKAFLEQPVRYQPGTHFLYNSGASHMLSAIVQKLSGQPLSEYLGSRLFEPLGIQSPTWETDPRGINTGGWGLKITTEDIACFGQMYLQKGVWNGKRILPEAWVAEATSKQVSNGDPSTPSDWQQGYGFQFWRCQHGAYRGDGAFGQYCVVMPDQQAVLAITSGVGNMQAVLDLVWKHLLPAMSAAPLPAVLTAQGALTKKLAGLALLPPKGKAASPLAERISGRTYRMERNPLGVRWARFDFSGGQCTLRMRDRRGEHQVTCGAGSWLEGSTTLLDRIPPMVAASAVWSAADTLLITLRSYETPFVHRMACRFDGDQVTIGTTVNVSFGPTTLPELKGRA